MDLLFKRYASPFLLLDEMLQQNKLYEFISELIKIVYEENKDDVTWDMYLHKVHNMSYQEFINRCNSESINSKNFEATVIDENIRMLDNFIPE